MNEIDCGCKCDCARRSGSWLTPGREKQLVYAAILAVVAASVVAIISIAMGAPRVWPGVVIGGVLAFLQGLRIYRPRQVRP